MGEPDRPSREEHPRQRDIDRKWRVIAAAEAAAERREMRIDALRLERRFGLAEEISEPFRDLIRRLDADNQFENLRPVIVPGEAALGLERHGVHGLGIELAVDDEHAGIAGGEELPDLLAIGGALGIVTALRDRKRLPDRPSAAIVEAGADEAFLKRRVDIRGVRRRSGDPGEAKRGVVGLRQRSGLGAEFQEIAVPEDHPRAIVGVEAVEQEQRHRLAEIERRLPDRAEQVAGVERRHPRPDPLEVVGRDHDGRLRIGRESIEVDALIEVGCVRGTDQEGVGGVRRPAIDVGRTEVRPVDLGAGDLGDAVDPALGGEGWLGRPRQGSASPRNRAPAPASAATGRA